MRPGDDVGALWEVELLLCFQQVGSQDLFSGVPVNFIRNLFAGGGGCLVFGSWATALQGGVNLLAMSVEPSLGISIAGGGEKWLLAQPRGCAGEILSKILAFGMNLSWTNGTEQPFSAIHHFC